MVKIGVKLGKVGDGEYYSKIDEPKIKRSCLKCEKNFIAIGFHNRVCGLCKRQITVDSFDRFTESGNYWIGQGRMIK